MKVEDSYKVNVSYIVCTHHCFMHAHYTHTQYVLIIIIMYNKGWISVLSENPEKNLLLCKLYICNEVPIVQYSIIIGNDMTWKLFVYGVECNVELEIIHLKKVSDIHNLITKLEEKKICQGNPDAKFDELQISRNGLFMNSKSKS